MDHGRERVDAIRSMGFTSEDEAKLLALVNDPTVIDLFRMVMPDTSSAEAAPFMKEALQRVLYCAGDGLDSLNMKRQSAVKQAVDSARAEWEKEHERAVATMRGEVTQVLGAQWQLALNQAVRKTDQAGEKKRLKEAAGARQAQRALITRLLSLEAAVQQALCRSEAAAGAEMRRLRVKRRLPFETLPAERRTMRSHVLPPHVPATREEGGEEEEEEEAAAAAADDAAFDAALHELDADAPDVDGALRDVEAALLHRADALSAGVVAGYEEVELRAVERVAEEKEQGDARAVAAAEEARAEGRRLAEKVGRSMAVAAVDGYKTRLEAARPEVASAGTETELTGAELAEMEEERARGVQEQVRVEAERGMRPARSTSVCSLFEAPADPVLTEARQCVANCLAVLDRLADSVKENLSVRRSLQKPLRACFSDTLVESLPAPSLSAEYLRGLRLKGVQVERAKQQPQEQTRCQGLMVLSAGGGGSGGGSGGGGACVYNDAGTGGGVNARPTGTQLHRLRGSGGGGGGIRGGVASAGRPAPRLLGTTGCSLRLSALPKQRLLPPPLPPAPPIAGNGDGDGVGEAAEPPRAASATGVRRTRPIPFQTAVLSH